MTCEIITTVKITNIPTTPKSFLMPLCKSILPHHQATIDRSSSSEFSASDGVLQDMVLPSHCTQPIFIAFALILPRRYAPRGQGPFLACGGWIGGSEFLVLQRSE